MTRHLRSAVLSCALLLGGCASLPDDAPVVEQLDEETGLTITRLGRPVELYRDTFQQDPAGRFAFIGPFETNSMGKRDLYLWIAIPVEPADTASPVVEADGKALALPNAGPTAEFAGLRTSPYKIPTPWSAMFYFKVDAALVEQLARAGTLTVRMTEKTKNGNVRTTFTAPVGQDPRLRAFAER